MKNVTKFLIASATAATILYLLSRSSEAEADATSTTITPTTISTDKPLPSLVRHTGAGIGMSQQDYTDLMKTFRNNNINVRLRTYWKDIEPTEGVFTLGTTKNALDIIEQEDLWCIGDFRTYDPPQWFIDKFPDCYLVSGSGGSNWCGGSSTCSDAGKKLLSPWFIASGDGDVILKNRMDTIIGELTKHKNVIGMWLEFKTTSIALSPFDTDGGRYNYWFKCFDKYAIASYQKTFGTGEIPPGNYDEYITRTIQDSTFADKFDKWHIESRVQTIDKLLGWIGDKLKYKVVYLFHIDNVDYANIVNGYTEYQSKQIFDVMAKYNNVIENFEGWEQITREGNLTFKNWAEERNLLFGGENGNVTGDIAKLTLAIDNFLIYNGDIFLYEPGTAVLDDNTLNQLKRITDAHPTPPPSEYFG